MTENNPAVSLDADELLRPNEGEAKEDFINRFMLDEGMKALIVEHSVRLDVAEAVWRFRESGLRDSLDGARFDRAQFRGEAKRTDEGYIRAEAIVSRVGVLLYPDASMPDGIRRELRHPDEVFSQASLDSLKQIPVTLDHPVTPRNPRGLLNSKNVNEFQVGNTGDNVRPIENQYLVTSMTVTSDAAVREVEAGVKELSLGYTQKRVRLDGVYEGQRYTHKQTKIRYNHLAIVDRGRAGAMARITLDKNDAIEIDKETADKAEQKKNGSNSMDLVKITLDSGRVVEVPESMALAYEDVKTRLDTAETKTKGLVEVKLDAEGKETGFASKNVAEAYGKVSADADGLQVKLDAAEKIDPEANAILAHDRMDIMDKARRVLDKDSLDKIEAKTLNLDIMRDVVIAGTPKDGQEAMVATLDAQKTNNETGYPSYVKARFDALDIPGVSAIDEQRAAASTRHDAKGKVDDVTSVSGETANLDTAKDDYNYRLRHQGKTRAEVEKGGK